MPRVSDRFRPSCCLSRLRRPCTLTILFAAALCIFIGVKLAAGDDDKAEVADVPTADGEDWPVFLGPEGNGVSHETGLAETWPKGGPPVLWEKAIGTGYSAPSVRGARLVVHHRLRNEEIVECLRAGNGEELWKFSYPSNFRDPYG